MIYSHKKIRKAYSFYMKKYVFLMILIIVYILTINYNKEKPLSFNNDVNTTNNKEAIMVNLYIDDDIKNLELEEYIVGVVACEMPASFNKEALKAMAVAARTYALSKLSNNLIETSLNDQCYNSTLEMNNKWGESFNAYYNKIKECVENTRGEYIAYDNKPIKAFYFSTSNGQTENVENVFSEKLDYLVSVDSKWDTTSTYFLNETAININEFLNKANVEKLESINIISRNQSNHVEKIEVNNIIYSGVEFRKLFNLKSTDFEIKSDNEKVTITTRGYGHGVGMSQYGANGMASEGYNYKEILNHYYTNTEIMCV